MQNTCQTTTFRHIRQSFQAATIKPTEENVKIMIIWYLLNNNKLHILVLLRIGFHHQKLKDILTHFLIMSLPFAGRGLRNLGQNANEIKLATTAYELLQHSDDTRELFIINNFLQLDRTDGRTTNKSRSSQNSWKSELRMLLPNTQNVTIIFMRNLCANTFHGRNWKHSVIKYVAYSSQWCHPQEMNSVGGFRRKFLEINKQSMIKRFISESNAP